MEADSEKLLAGCAVTRWSRTLCQLEVVVVDSEAAVMHTAKEALIDCSLALILPQPLGCPLSETAVLNAWWSRPTVH